MNSGLENGLQIVVPVLVSNGPSQMQALLLLATFLFLVLSPGFIVNLPPNSVQYCQNNLNIEDCPSFGPKCRQCSSVWATNFTSGPAILTHALIFLVLLILLSLLISDSN